MNRVSGLLVSAVPSALSRCAVAMLTLAACAADSAFGPPIERGNEMIQTDALEYVATLRGGSGAHKRYGVKIVATFTNRTEMPLWLERCFPTSPQPMYNISIDEQQNGADFSKMPMYSYAHACVGHDQQFRVEPGAQRTDTLDVSGPNTWQNDKPLGRSDGRMRISYIVSTCRGDLPCPLVGFETRSHPFDMRIAR